MDQITIGADPELFLINKNNKLISSIGKFGGTKKYPQPIGHNCYVQEDNVAVEFNIPPSKSKEAFITSINFALEKLNERARELNLELAIIPAASFDKDQLRHPEAKVFGCDPDQNAWSLKYNDPPKCKDVSLRSAGGHIHIGCMVYAPYDIARAMDLFLGVPSIWIDKDTKRRELYGKAGAYRAKPYGAEYRTLSNFWLKSDKLKEWAYTQAQNALKFLELGNRLDPNKEDGQEIQDCINNSDTSLMTNLVTKYHLELP